MSHVGDKVVKLTHKSTMLNKELLGPCVGLRLQLNPLLGKDGNT